MTEHKSTAIDEILQNIIAALTVSFAAISLGAVIGAVGPEH